MSRITRVSGTTSRTGTLLVRRRGSDAWPRAIRRAASRCSPAARWPRGGACYAPEIMGSLGFLTPDERVAEQHTRVRLMARAVVDLELHTGRMTFDEAARVHVAAAQLTPAAAHAEATKCSMFPGTAMMYWLGLRDLW